jgi:hypothetical protein
MGYCDGPSLAEEEEKSWVCLRDGWLDWVKLCKYTQSTVGSEFCAAAGNFGEKVQRG